MEKSLIALVESNFEKVKENKINFEISSLNEAFEDEMIGVIELKTEIENVKDIFSKCSTAEELIRAISIRDFDDESCTDEYLLHNIECLIS